MTCKDVLDELRRPAMPGAEALRHAAGCPGCGPLVRAAALLWLGSAVDDQAAPGPGFEQRLRARIARDAGDRAGARQGTPSARAGRTAPAATWNGGFELLVRPALALAATLALICGGFYLTAPAAADDLASLAGTDPVYDSMMVVSPDTVLPLDIDTAPETAP